MGISFAASLILSMAFRDPVWWKSGRLCLAGLTFTGKSLAVEQIRIHRVNLKSVHSGGHQPNNILSCQIQMPVTRISEGINRWKD
jgi:hypothetical protein